MNTNESRHHKKDYPALTALRGWLAVMVVLYHFSENAQKLGIPLPGYIAEGHVAVSAFFILSGFILCRVYVDQQTDWGAFFKARFARVYPIYFLGIVSIAPIVIYAARLTPGSQSETFRDLFLTITCLQSWHSVTWHKWNLVGWSICCEVFFYALFPFILSTILRSRSQLTLVVILLGIMSGLGYQPTTYGSGAHFQWIHHHSPLVRLPEFCLGVAAALLPVSRCSSRAAVVLSSIFFLLIGALLELPGDVALLALIPSLWAVLIYILSSEAVSGVPKALIWLGQISYSLYIFHIIAATYLKPGSRWALGDYGFVLQIALCIPVAHFLYKYVEVPMRAKILSSLKG